MQVSSSIAAARQLVDTVFYKNAEKFLAKSQELNAVIALLADQPSRQQFLDELAFLIVSGVNSAVAASYASPMRPARWKEIAAGWDAFAVSEDFPTMEAPEGETGFLKNMMMTTFLAEQYAYGGTVTVERGDVVLDCGACFGDTALWAYGRGAAEVHSFEPSPFNHRWLVRNIRNNGRDDSLCRQMAVGEAEAELPFVAAPGVAGSSRVSGHGNVSTRCVRLDDYCQEHGVVPDFVKMDVEGFEVAALRGCREIIGRHAPRLAICLYHKPSDMWEIPLLIHEMRPDYRMYCRKNNVANEFVLYAVRG